MENTDPLRKWARLDALDHDRACIIAAQLFDGIGASVSGLAAGLVVDHFGYGQ